MKKSFYIGFIVLGLTAVSCSKQNIRPNAENQEEIPMWRGVTEIESDTDHGSSTGGSTITDPNNDPDGNRRKKQ